MSQKNTILVSLIVIILFALVAVPNFVRDPWTGPQNACINNLRCIDAAKQQWAVENHKTNGPVTWNEILPYLDMVQREQGRKIEFPHCPSGGTYTIGNIGEPPTCSIAGHALTPN
jgi:hypothetical protein